MTSPEPTPAPPTPPPGTQTPVTGSLPSDALVTLTEAVARETAAVWAYGLIAAFDLENASLVESARVAHLSRRDQAAGIVAGSGGVPPAPAPSYSAPAVSDALTARAFAIQVEEDCGNAWFAVIGNTDIPELRWMALAGLTDAATTATRFRTASAAPRVTEPFPGRP